MIKLQDMLIDNLFSCDFWSMISKVQERSHCFYKTKKDSQMSTRQTVSDPARWNNTPQSQIFVSLINEKQKYVLLLLSLIKKTRMEMEMFYRWESSKLVSPAQAPVSHRPWSDLGLT